MIFLGWTFPLYTSAGVWWLTAAKKLVALRWKNPHDLSYQHWINTVTDLAKLEKSVASMHGAHKKNIDSWSSLISRLMG